jgi:hypothetical protein
MRQSGRGRHGGVFGRNDLFFENPSNARPKQPSWSTRKTEAKLKKVFCFFFQKRTALFLFFFEKKNQKTFG